MPRRRISGWAQWWPARTQTPAEPRISATSCGWTPSSAKLDERRRARAARGRQARHLGEALERVGGELAVVLGDRCPARCR